MSVTLERVILGRTGLEVTVAGLGSGGHSKLGLRGDGGEDGAVAVVRRALDLGINLIDSSEVYGTEEAIGKGIEGRRDEVVLATKLAPHTKDGHKGPEEIERSLDASLRRLRMDRIDVYQVHGVNAQEYDAVVRDVYPTLLRMREKGKIRFIGITEAFASDTGHAMLARATAEDIWDTIMVGFNLLNPCARRVVLPQAIERNIGVLCMFAVRRALTSIENLRAFANDMIDRGLVPADELDRERPLGFLLDDGVAGSLAEAAYRFCRHEAGLHCILSGTGSIAHLEENARALGMPPLSNAAHARLTDLFGRIDSVSGN